MLSFYAVTTFKIMRSSTNHFQLGLITATTFCHRHHLLPAEGQGPLQKELGAKKRFLPREMNLVVNQGLEVGWQLNLS